MFQRKLDKERESQGYSVTQLADEAGIAPASLSRIINGHTHPRFRTEMKLAEVLGVEMDDLFDGPVSVEGSE